MTRLPALSCAALVAAKCDAPVVLAADALPQLLTANQGPTAPAPVLRPFVDE